MAILLAKKIKTYKQNLKHIKLQLINLFFFYKKIK